MTRLACQPALQSELRARLRTWRPDFAGTLTFVCVGGQILLIRKKRGHGAGKINAPGGKIDPGETPLACAIRETREEVGVEALNPSLMAELKFVDQADAQWLGYAFVARDFRGEPAETAEAEPFWAPLDQIPYDQMWEDDRIWLPKILAGQRIKAAFLFRAGKLLCHFLEDAE